MKPEAIAQLRAAMGWAQTTLAALLHTSPMAVSRWERGEAQPAPHQVFCLLTWANIAGAELGKLTAQKLANDDPVGALALLFSTAAGGK